MGRGIVRGRSGVIICFLLVGVLTGCTVVRKDKNGGKDLEFAVMEEDEIPGEMKALIEARKEKPFWMTWGDGEYLYIGQGYGEKSTGGYQVIVDGCVETEEAVYIHTMLQGPGQGEKVSEKKSFPYVVIRVKWKEKHVVFQKNQEE